MAGAVHAEPQGDGSYGEGSTGMSGMDRLTELQNMLDGCVCGEYRAEAEANERLRKWASDNAAAIARELLAHRRASQAAAAHEDDLAVDQFAAAMKAKLAKKRNDGRGGWSGPECSEETLSRMLRDHVGKGDPVDVANFAMMLHQRGERIAQAAPAPQDADRAMLIKELSDAARWRRLPDNESQLATAVLFERAVAALSAAPAPSDGLREENERLRSALAAAAVWSVEDSVTLKEIGDVMRPFYRPDALPPAQEGEPRHD